MVENATALCKLEDLKLYMDIKTEDGEVDDADLLIGLINQITAAMENYCGLKHFQSTVYTEYFDGGGVNELYPDHYPITSVSGIFDDDSWTWDSDTEISGTDYRIVDHNRILLKSYNIFGDWAQNVKVVYTAGFASIPEDLKLACAKEVARLFRTRNDKGVESRSVQNNNTFSRYVMEEFLPETKSVLNRYRVKGAK
jgi:hypothetical protein